MQRILVVIFYFVVSFLHAQDTLMPIIFLDDVVISQDNDGFSVEDFVSYVKQDTTFYMGFKHLRYYSHKYESELSIFNKKGNKIGVLKQVGTHHSDGMNAWIVHDYVFDEGKIYKRNGDYRYYTPKAFEEVFFPKDTIGVSLDISSDQNSNDSQNMRDAKTVGFSIGTDNVEQSKGGISRKLAIFDVEMQQYYDYIIGETVYKDRECYTFNIKVKDDLSKKDLKKTLIRNLVSYFDKENFNVIYREYRFVYRTWLIDLDMNIIVNMDYIKGRHFPIDIYYKGFWDVMFFKPERAEFSLINTLYKVH